MARGLSVSMQIEGLAKTRARLRELPKAAKVAMADASLIIAGNLAMDIARAALADSSQSALMAPTVKARRAGVPIIQAGGTMAVGRHRKPAWKVLFGSEFGANRYPQFRRHVPKGGSYWFFRTARARMPIVSARWLGAAELVTRRFGRS